PECDPDGLLRGGAEGPRRARERRHRVPRRLAVSFRGRVGVPDGPRSVDPHRDPRRARVPRDLGPRDHERHRGHARRCGSSHVAAEDRSESRRGDRGARRRPRSRPQVSRARLSRHGGRFDRGDAGQGGRDRPGDQGGGPCPRHLVPRERREPLAPRGRVVLHEPPEQPRSAPDRRGAASRCAGRQGLGTRDDSDGVPRSRTGDARRGGRGRGPDQPQDSDRRRAVRARRADARDETRLPRGRERRPGAGADESDPGRAGSDRHPPRRGRWHPDAGGREGGREGRRRRRRHGDDRRGGPRGRRAPPDHRGGEGGLMHVLRAKTVAESHAETTRMARRLFVSPPARRMVLPILAFSLMESFLLVYPSLDGWRVAWGALAFALPAYLAAYATVPLAERLGGRMYFRRSFLLVFVGLIMVGAIELVVVVALTAYSIFGGTTYAFRIDRAVVLGYGAVLWIRAVILTATSNSMYVRTLPAASLHPVLGLTGLAVFARLGVWDIVMALAVYALFFLSAVAYTEIA